MIVHVTQEDIDNGQYGCSCCPIALAASRAYGRPIFVGAYSYHIFEKDGKTITGRLPTEAQEFVANFDFGNRDSLKPFSFMVGEYIVEST